MCAVCSIDAGGLGIFPIFLCLGLSGRECTAGSRSGRHPADGPYLWVFPPWCSQKLGLISILLALVAVLSGIATRVLCV